MTSPVDYAEKGYAVLPCWWIKDDGACACGNAACHAKGKHPINSLVPRGVLDASGDPAVVAGWLAKVPLANWGLAMGMNGLIAVDIDPRNGGDATWEALIIKYGEPPETWTARTGGGGTHLIFALPDGMSVPGKWGNGIDLKHGNGYVLVEPSRTQAAYCWLDDLSPLEDAPLAEFIGFPKEDEEAAPAKNVVRMVDSATLADLRAALTWLDSDRR
ncbi:MAG: bifunctional DNA primase/polymerase, partial [Candidatus Accumulibacter sp.]|uniref:bifunctional DNA primase/polymerase n=1 Tax=Accumulibacter sp. TaxID=2053492 RepID=UPI0025909FCB